MELLKINISEHTIVFDRGCNSKKNLLEVKDHGEAHFEDISILKGWAQYYDENGTEWRRHEDQIYGYYSFYRYNGDVFVFNHAGFSRKSGVREIHTDCLRSIPAK